MRTNIELDRELIEEIMRLTAISTKKEVVNRALEEYLRKLKLAELARSCRKDRGGWGFGGDERR